MPKILNIVESAYRATIEEQDDTVLWFAHMLANAGAEIAILLRGNAVNYLNKSQKVATLRFGESELGNPPRIAEDIGALIAKRNVPVFYVEEDAQERGLNAPELVSGTRPVPRRELPKLVAGYERVFHW